MARKRSRRRSKSSKDQERSQVGEQPDDARATDSRTSSSAPDTPEPPIGEGPTKVYMSENEIRRSGLAIDIPYDGLPAQPQRLKYAEGAGDPNADPHESFDDSEQVYVAQPPSDLD